MSNDIDDRPSPYSLRGLHGKLRDRLQAAADAHDLPLSQEILERLAMSLDARPLESLKPDELKQEIRVMTEQLLALTLRLQRAHDLLDDTARPQKQKNR